MSKYTSFWTFLVGVPDALVTRGDFNYAYKQRLPKNIPATHKRVVVSNVESEEDLDDSSDGLILWQGIYRFNVLRNSFGADGDSQDEFIGTTDDPGIGVLTDRLIVNLEKNIKDLGSSCVWRFTKVEYGQRDKEPRLASTFSLEIEGPQNVGRRGGSVSGSVTLVSL
jgi:hypothetical protein